MLLLMWDPQSPVELYYSSGSGFDYEVVSLHGPAEQYWPELAELGRTLQGNHYTEDRSASFVTNIRIENPGNRPLPSPISENYQWDAVRGITKDYTERLRAGEVLMNPYSVGKAEVRRNLALGDPKPTSSDAVGAEIGWLLGFDAIAAKMPNLTMPSRVEYRGKTLKPSGCTALLVWRWVFVPDTEVYVSPAVSFPAKLPDIATDAGLVTQVAADAANGVLDLLTELIELPETMKFAGKLVGDACMLTADLEEEARAMRKRLPVAAFSKWLSSHWLKGRYALMPIFYMLQDIQQVLNQMEQEYAEYRAKKEIDSPYPFDLPAGTICEDMPLTHRCLIRSRYTPDTLMAALKRLLNVNLASTAWELTTLSFVADWAFNIGDYIAALTGTDDASESKCSYSVRNQAEYAISYDSTDPVLRNLKTYVKLDTYQRIIIDPSDRIGLTFDVNMNWKRSIDAFALFSQPGIKRLERLLRA